MASSDSNLAKLILKVEWKSIEIDQRKFLFKSIFETNEFEILLFDMNNFKLFYLKNDEFDIKENFKILNPKSESPTNILVEHLKNNFDSTSELKFVNDSNSDELKIKLTGMFAGQKNFNWLFEFSSLNLSHMRNQLVLPLLFDISEMQQREKELIEIIKQKDKELDDYRSQGYSLTRKYLFTNTFDTKIFEDGMKNKTSNETLENPFDILQSDYLSKIGATCLNKYYKSFFKLDDAKKVEENSQSNEKEDSSQVKSSNEKKHKLERLPSQDDIATKKQKEQAEREEREKQLEKEIEEAAKKKARQEQNKKKKLMK